LAQAIPAQSDPSQPFGGCSGALLVVAMQRGAVLCAALALLLSTVASECSDLTGLCGEADDEPALSLRQLRAEKDQTGAGLEAADASEALRKAAEELEVEQMYGAANVTEEELGVGMRSAGIEMIPYPETFCRKCGEMAFCHRAGNPGCGGHATHGVASFQNRNEGTGCPVSAALTVPRSYVRDINVLKKHPGASETLRQMLESGFRFYHQRGYHGPVWQCIHQANGVSVRWLHLHTFCLDGQVDGLPTHHDFCAKMHNVEEASTIAGKWLR